MSEIESWRPLQGCIILLTRSKSLMGCSIKLGINDKESITGSLHACAQGCSKPENIYIYRQISTKTAARQDTTIEEIKKRCRTSLYIQKCRLKNRCRSSPVSKKRHCSAQRAAATRKATHLPRNLPVLSVPTHSPDHLISPQPRPTRQPDPPIPNRQLFSPNLRATATTTYRDNIFARHPRTRRPRIRPSRGLLYIWIGRPVRRIRCPRIVRIWITTSAPIIAAITTGSAFISPIRARTTYRSRARRAPPAREFCFQPICAAQRLLLATAARRRRCRRRGLSSLVAACALTWQRPRCRR